jgi:prevent-host-death family protein
MKHAISVSAAKNTLSALLRKVRAGTTITITDRGVPVARLVPPLAPVAGLPPRFIELAQQGILKLPEVEPTPEWISDLPRAPRLGKGASAVAALVAERRTGR